MKVIESCSTYNSTTYTFNTFGLYVCTEGVGGKGGKDVSFLIYKYLIDAGFFSLAQSHRPGKRLTPIFDNCAGQNKNRMVIRFM